MKKIISKFIVFLFVLAAALSGSAGGVYADASADASSNRISGNDRIETSLKISESGWKDGADTVVIAQGYGYADALCAAPLAKKYNAPIILSGQDALSSDTISEIKRLKAKQAFVIGGTGSLSTNVESQLKSLGISHLERLGGADRYETSVKIAQKLENTDNIVIASGEGYADSLSIAPIAAARGMPILLTGNNSLPDAVDSYIKGTKVNKTYVVGGVGVVEDSLKNALPNAQRLGGATRFDTNLAILQNFKSDLNFDNVYIAEGDGPSGDEFADALSGAALAAQKSALLVLVYKTMTSESLDFIVGNMSGKTVVTALGGTSVVPDEIVKGVLDDYSKANPNPGNPGSGGGGGSSTPVQQDTKLVDIDGTDNGGLSLTITETADKVINIQASCKNVLDNITITLYDESGNLKYINQAAGSMNLSTVLVSGKYTGFINASSTGKTTIPEFTVK
ncbi:cell wall-binding repeat-containing protein [Clostridium luticellarii]|jgi:putative cell wall-binding protein|uniref:cell wall-binding repeat-containing protein n=1 Tax=Clostridium luticellarii TaxID=1691940 RepID=UPI002354F676|nr:cell wall-binding repeat-containing protein [Clostridium luticellarii]MCI1944758.1 cell wall-binding repeat-containing protein [Clostridium luticellarii]MCI1968253.1 cell wall-binding repeat-containing protein [Clostridium luticellarii]